MTTQTPRDEKEWPGFVASWLIENVVSYLEREDNKYSHQEISDMSILVAQLLFHDKITYAKSRELFKTWWDTGEDVYKQNEKIRVLKLTDAETVELCIKVAVDSKDVMEQCSSGNFKKFGSMMGKVMKSSSNCCDPDKARGFLTWLSSVWNAVDWSDEVQAVYFMMGYLDISDYKYQGDRYFDETPLDDKTGPSNQPSPPALPKNKKLDQNFKKDQEESR